MTQIFKKFIWDPTWVRPFESPFSVLANFGRVNVLSSKKALILMQYSPAEYRDLTHKLASSNNAAFSETHLFQSFYPNDYRSFHFIPCDSQLPSSVQLYDELHYCPRCLYDSGYHSVVHQVKGLKKCPIHDIPLQTVHSPYYTFPSLPDSIRKTDTNDINPTYINVHKLPLPPERKELDLSGISNLDRLNPGHILYDVIGPSNEKTTEHFDPYSLTDFRDMTEVRCFHASYLEKGMEDEFDKEYIKGFKLTYPYLDEDIQTNYGSFATMDDYLSALINDMRGFYHRHLLDYYPLSIEQLCVMELMATCSPQGLFAMQRLNSPIDTLEQLDYINEDMLKICFSYLMVGCQFPKDIISPCYHHYNYHHDIDKPRTNLDLSISHLKYAAKSSFLINTRLYIHYIVQRDKFRFLWNEFHRVVEEEKLQDLSSIAARLPLVRYIITKDDTEMFHVYRQIVIRD